ncbi:2-hydroxyacyl-CoA dehydratase [bacterium]|nr:2-hydroxyacyl-CoA dehydratase [bacterium]
MKIGIPRSLLYYHYFPLWKSFFEELGLEVVLSSPTNKKILENGVKKAVDDACLPVKLYFGHVMELADKVDYIFVPRLVSVEEDAFTCPKIIGLPDMLRASLDKLPPLLDTCFDLKKGISPYRSFQELGRKFNKGSQAIRRAFEKAEQRQDEFKKTMQNGLTPPEAMEMLDGKSEEPRTKNGELRIALIGHPYNLYDSYINMNLMDKIQQLGASVITAEMLPSSIMEKEASRWRKEIFWTFGRRMVGAAFHFFNSSEVDGVISCIAFECGPDSLLGVLIEDEAKRHKEIPYMSLILDEHSGETGIVTRVEAFLDMIRRKR